MMEPALFSSGILEWVGAILINFGVHSTIGLGVALGLSYTLKSPHLRASSLRWGVVLPFMSLPTLWGVSQPSGPGAGVTVAVLESPIFVGAAEASVAGVPLIPMLVLAWAVVAGVRLMTFLGRVMMESLRGPRGIPMGDDSLTQLERRLTEPLRSRVRQLSLRQLAPGEAAYCSLRGDICIPENVIEVLSPEEFSALLGHELGHIKGGDLRAHLGLQLMERLFFFQPLLWWASRRHAHVIEEAADAFCLHLTQDPISLAGALKALAELNLGHRLRAASLGMRGPSPLVKRVEAILRGPRALPSGMQRSFMAIGWGLLLMGVMSLPSVKAHDLPQVGAASEGLLGEAPGAESGSGGEKATEETRQGGGSLRGELVAKGLKDVRLKVDVCFAKAEPGAEGKVVIKSTYAPSGEILDAEIVETTLNQPLVEACLAEAMTSTVFPAFDGDIAQFTIPFLFKDSP